MNTTNILSEKELANELSALGYRFWWFLGGEGTQLTVYGLTREVEDFLHPLPVEEDIRKALRGTEGKIIMDATVSIEGRGGEIVRVSYNYRYQVTGTRGLAKALVEVRGDLDAPFPYGQAISCEVERTTLYVGPIPGGKGQKTRAREAIREGLASIPSFGEVFPNARIRALLETRGGRGGWKPKVAHHDAGTIADWLSGLGHPAF